MRIKDPFDPNLHYSQRPKFAIVVKCCGSKLNFYARPARLDPNESEHQQPERLDLRSLQQYACVSERTLREWIHRAFKPLPAVRVGTKILVRRSVFDPWLEAHQINHIDLGCIVDEMVSAVTGTNDRHERMSVKIRKRGGKWYVFVNYRGQRKAKCVGTRQAAEEVRCQLEARLALGDLGFFNEAGKPMPIFKDFAEGWLGTHAEVECKPLH